MSEFFKERAMAIFIGLIMLFSVVGWALTSMVPDNTGPEFSIPTIVTQELTNDEVRYVLQTGRVLIEYFYTENSTAYIDELPILEMFANQFTGFVVLEEVMGNLTRFEMIGINGQILDLSDEDITFDNIFEIFCGIAIAQPVECLL